MGIINGNSLIFQLGKEGSTYGTAATPTNQIRLSSENLKATYNKVDEGLLTGAKGAGRKELMSQKVEGDISTLARPDEVGLFLACALGKETAAGVSGVTGAYKHTFTAIGNAESDSLPSLTAFVDRKAEKFNYTGLKINTLSFNASPEDYLKLDVSFVGKREVTGATGATSLTPSALRSFKFRQGAVYLDASGATTSTKIADITSIKFDYNNNLMADVQTTSTGLYYKEPECGTREISTEVEMLYTSGTEKYRQNYYSADANVKLVLEFISDEVIAGTTCHSLKITVPYNQCSDATANMTGADATKQTMKFDAYDAGGSNELITVELVNNKSGSY